jgi:hypothetical protein
MGELKVWLKESFEVFPKLKKKKIDIDYKIMSFKKLGYVRAKIKKDYDFDAEQLLLGEFTKVKSKISNPSNYEIYINSGLQKIKNQAVRKQMIQHILIHELLHIENEDLITLQKDYSKRKKKKIHVNEFEEDVFFRFNELRRINSIMQIEKREHLEIALKRILESIGWGKK